MIEYCCLASGSSGNSHFVSTENCAVLVDVGKSARYVRQALTELARDMSAIELVLITHEHIDHIRGLSVLAKFFNFQIVLNQPTYLQVKARFPEIPRSRFEVIEAGSYTHKDLTFEAFPVIHDAAATFGYSFGDGSSKISIASDVGVINQQLKRHLQDSDLIVIDCNHDEDLVWNGNYPQSVKDRILSNWGHLSNRTVGEFLSTLRQPENGLVAVLQHLSEENNQADLAIKTIRDIIEQNLDGNGHKIQLEVARRSEVSCWHKF